MARRSGKTGTSTNVERALIILPKDVASERGRVAAAKSKLHRSDTVTWYVPKKKE